MPTEFAAGARGLAIERLRERGVAVAAGQVASVQVAHAADVLAQGGLDGLGERRAPILASLPWRTRAALRTSFARRAGPAAAKRGL